MRHCRALSASALVVPPGMQLPSLIEVAEGRFWELLAFLLTGAQRERGIALVFISICFTNPMPISSILGHARSPWQWDIPWEVAYGTVRFRSVGRGGSWGQRLGIPSQEGSWKLVKLAPVPMRIGLVQSWGMSQRHSSSCLSTRAGQKAKWASPVQTASQEDKWQAAKWLQLGSGREQR